MRANNSSLRFADLTAQALPLRMPLRRLPNTNRRTCPTSLGW